MRSSKTVRTSSRSDSRKADSRRSFIKKTLTAGAAVSASGAYAGDAAADVSQASGIGALDHVAIPIQNVEQMMAFYRALGFTVRDGERTISIHFGDQKINFHRPSFWQSGTFTLRAPAAQPPCGDFCWVWEGTEAALTAMIGRAGAPIEAEGERTGGRNGGNDVGQSVYVRDPDGNLLEFIRYP